MNPDFTIDSYFRQCVGIDIAKQKFNACLYMYDLAGDSGCHTKSIEFTNNKTGFNQLVKWVRKESVKDRKIFFIMEPSGVYHETLASHLHKLGFTVYVVLPNKARDFARYNGIKTKNDIVDSISLGLMGCTCRTLKAWTPPLPIYQELKQMTRFNQDLHKIRNIVTNHLEALCHSVDVERSLVSHYRCLLKEIEAKIEKNDRNILGKVKSDPELYKRIERVSTIKGIGLATVIGILAETQGFALITNRRQLASYAGLDVESRQSGPNDPRHHITKRGNARIRHMLYMPALVALKHNKQSKDTYTRIISKHPTEKMIGVVAVMRKLLLLIYTLWKNGEEYRPDKTTTSTPPKKRKETDQEGRQLIKDSKMDDTYYQIPSETEDVKMADLITEASHTG